MPDNHKQLATMLRALAYQRDEDESATSDGSELREAADLIEKQAAVLEGLLDDDAIIEGAGELMGLVGPEKRFYLARKIVKAALQHAQEGST